LKQATIGGRILATASQGIDEGGSADGSHE
jgi:hypothetical protein